MAWFTGRRRINRPKQSLERRFVGRLLRLPSRLLESLAGGPVVVDGRRLDPIYRFLLRFAARGPKIHHMEPEASRRWLKKKLELVRTDPLLMDRVEDREIETAAGPLPVRIYLPPNLAEDPAPAVVYFHGGGWVQGDLDSHHPLCTLLAQRVPCRVISVDYRLGPEHPFPGAVEDAVAAYRWVVGEAASLRIDPNRIALVGDSAGGNLATVACLALRNVGDVPPPCLQVLMYPVTDRLREGGSYELFADGFALDRDSVKWFFLHYVGDERGIDDPRFAPLCAPDLTGLPTALVATAFFDVLRDEGDEYARALADAGVEVRHFSFDDQVHAFANFTGVVPSARAAVDEICSEMAYRFHQLKQG